MEHEAALMCQIGFGEGTAAAELCTGKDPDLRQFTNRRKLSSVESIAAKFKARQQGGDTDHPFRDVISNSLPDDMNTPLISLGV